MKEQNIDYLSGEVREILGKPPSWATSWAFGITLSALVFLLLAGFTFKYPEIIHGDLILSTAEPPVNADSPQSGVLETIKVKEGDFVTKNMLLAIFENDADVDDVLELENDINQLNTLDVDAIRAFTPNRSLELDQQLEILYDDFISSLEFVPLFEGEQIDQEAINAILLENRQLERSNLSLLDAIESAKLDIVSKDKLMSNIQELYGDNPSETKYSTQLFEIAQDKGEINTETKRLQSSIQKNLETIRNNNSRIWQMRANKTSGTQERIFRLRQSISALRKAIANWKEDNLVLAPADGKVSFFANLELKKRFKKGEELVAIIPITEQTEYTGLVNIPIEGSGKVKDGQEVNLKFHRYPFFEFGQVKGRITKIYPVSKDGVTAVEVTLDKGLKTSAGKTLEYYQQMEGKAEIITEKQLFVLRLFEKLRR